MSLSKSLQKGQVPMSCQMCEESNEIKWKCLLCDFLLCTKCQKLHKKVKSTDQHTIIDIKDIAAYQQEAKDQPDIINIPCSVHNGQNCCLFCKTCEEGICPSCILTAHNKHNMIGLSEGYNLTMKAVKTFHAEIKENILQTEKGLSKLSLNESSEESRYESERQKILDREKALKNEVEKHTQNLLIDLDRQMDYLRKSVHNEENRSKKIKKDLVIRGENLSRSFSQHNANEIFDIFKQEVALRAVGKQKLEPVNTKFKGLPQYIPGKQPILISQHGELNECTDDKEQEKWEFQVVQQFKTKLGLVENLVCCEDGTLWINHFFAKKLQKIQLKKGSVPVHVIKKLKTNLIFNMALLPTGDLLISLMESVLQILSHTTGELNQSAYNFSPLQTIAVHVTKANQIIVGVREKGEPFLVKGPRQVVVTDMDGRREKVYHLDNDGQTMFTVPARITSHNDNNIFVLDRLNTDMDGRIVAIHKTNGIRWVYSGHQHISKQHNFRPSDLLATSSDILIVTDMDIHMIHFLNNAGQCMHYLSTKDQLGIELPFSLDIDNTGILYIGCNSCGFDKAKIYTVRVS
ncbi:uncharacterized protein LOC134710369 [Mytilus trossulus]|uniref:uncharacterized protein LOC134710369 n=1 Tax=Mytilus trossulus TaxID=6551 RepID=UPI0030059D61